MNGIPMVCWRQTFEAIRRSELELLRAFRALPSEELQRQILRLVRSMGRALPAA